MKHKTIFTLEGSTIMNYIALENRNLEIAQVFIFVRVVAWYWKDLCVLDFRREYFLKGGGRV